MSLVVGYNDTTLILRQGHPKSFSVTLHNLVIFYDVSFKAVGTLNLKRSRIKVSFLKNFVEKIFAFMQDYCYIPYKVHSWKI